MHQAYVREYYEVNEKEILLKLAFLPGIIIFIVYILISQIMDISISKYFLGTESNILDLCIVLGVFFLFIINLFSHVLRMQGKGWSFSATQIIPRLGYLIIVIFIVCFLKEINYQQLIITNVLVLFFSILCFTYILWEEIKQGYKAKYDAIILKKMLSFSFPLLAGSISYWALTSMDRLMLSYFMDFDDLGVYVVAVTLASGIGVFVTVFSNLWHPIVYKWVKEGIDHTKIVLVNEVMVLGVAGLWTLVGICSWSFVYIFPIQYAEIQYIIVACVAMPLLYMLSETTNIGIGISRRTGYAMLSSVLALSINVIVNYFTIPKFGIKGTALASMTAFVFFLVFRTEFSCYLWMQLPRLKMYIFLMIYSILTLIHVFEIFSILVVIVSWLLGFVVVCIIYLGRLHWLITKIYKGGGRC